MIDIWNRDVDRAQCSACRFYRHQWSCHRHAPIAMAVVKPGFPNVVWPDVREDDWCGDFEPIRVGE